MRQRSTLLPKWQTAAATLLLAAGVLVLSASAQSLPPLYPEVGSGTQILNDNHLLRGPR